MKVLNPRFYGVLEIPLPPGLDSGTYGCLVATLLSQFYVSKLSFEQQDGLAWMCITPASEQSFDAREVVDCVSLMVQDHRDGESAAA